MENMVITKNGKETILNPKDYFESGQKYDRDYDGTTKQNKNEYVYIQWLQQTIMSNI